MCESIGHRRGRCPKRKAFRHRYRLRVNHKRNSHTDKYANQPKGRMACKHAKIDPDRSRQTQMETEVVETKKDKKTSRQIPSANSKSNTEEALQPKLIVSAFSSQALPVTNCEPLKIRWQFVFFSLVRATLHVTLSVGRSGRRSVVPFFFFFFHF